MQLGDENDLSQLIEKKPSTYWPATLMTVNCAFIAFAYSAQANCHCIEQGNIYLLTSLNSIYLMSGTSLDMKYVSYSPSNHFEQAR